MRVPDADRCHAKELTAIPGLTVLTEPDDLERYSRDAYDYSPVLRERLADCRADVVVRPDSVDAVVQVAGLCRRHDVPLTLRGSGTGNYGQCAARGRGGHADGPSSFRASHRSGHR